MRTHDADDPRSAVKSREVSRRHARPGPLTPSSFTGLAALLACLALVTGGDAAAEPAQTHDRPVASGAAFDARIAALWDGIAHDEPARAMPAFFPVTAYEQVKDIDHPAADWNSRLVAHFERDVHALHKRVGEHATFVRAEVPDGRARWVDRGEESNKLGYYRVFGTRIVYAVDGTEQSFAVTSLISWRGEWFVVHLTGVK